MKSWAHRRWWSTTLVYIALMVYVLFAAFPLFWLVVSSIKPESELFGFGSPFAVLPKRPTFEHYDQILRNSPFVMLLRNSVILSISTTVLSVIVAGLGAYSLSRLRFRGKEIFSGLVLLTYMFPAVSLLVPLFVLVTQLGLRNTYLGVILAYTTFAIPFALWMMRSYFLAIPLDLDEAARIDGATEWQVFTRIVLPLAAPGVAATAIFSFIHAWNEFLFGLILTSSDAIRPLTVGIYYLIGGEFAFRWGPLLAMGTLFLVPTMVFFMIIQRHIARGLTGGAIRG